MEKVIVTKFRTRLAIELQFLYTYHFFHFELLVFLMVEAANHKNIFNN